MKTLVIDNQTKHIEGWKQLGQRAGLEMTFVSYLGVDPSQADEYDFVILTGGSGVVPLKEGENAKILSWRDRFGAEFQKEKDFVAGRSKPTLGVCFGFELIADVFDAKIEYREERVKGLDVVMVGETHPIFGDMTTFRGEKAHKYYVDRLPGVLKELARSSSGVEVFKHKEKDLYGFQFHPEIDSPENESVQVFLNLIQLVKESSG